MTAEQTDQRLYGRSCAEELWFDPDEAIDRYLDDYIGDVHPGDMVVFAIEEWSVHPPRYHMPTVDFVLEHISDWTYDNGEVGEGFDVPIGDAEVIAAADALLDLIASKVTYRMADKHIGTITVTATLRDDQTWEWECAS